MSADPAAGFTAAGFVLAGGASSRMGRDKALLEINGVTLLERIAATVRDAAGEVTVIGPESSYGRFGFPVVADMIAGCGPLGGLYTALKTTAADWNVVVACDMPGITSKFLKTLLDAAIRADAMCLAPETVNGLEPLCAVYHRRCLAAAEAAIKRKLFKMQDFVSALPAVVWPVAEQHLLLNANTPAEWASR